jgi:DNA replication protein DnaC
LPSKSSTFTRPTQRQSTPKQKWNLPRLNNAEFDFVAKLARKSSIPLSQCPTCLATEIEIAPDVWGWENGTYRYMGQEHQCDCDTQIALRKHYLLAGIGDQYMRLDWADFHGTPEVREAVELFLDKWDRFKLNGMGLEFSSPNLGVGKTFAATFVGKELIKRGEKVYFIPFLEVINLLSRDEAYRSEMEDKLRDVTVLILDEVVPPWTERMGQLFAGKFEELIRHRTNYNRVTVMTTNLEPHQLHEHYPRTYSLLEAKQVRVEMGGEDARQTFIGMQNIELVANDEVRPIT